MPNYTLTSGSTFKPFTFDELLKPALMATQYHRELDEKYTELDTQVEALRQRANAEPNSEWSKRLLDYADSIEAGASELAKNGLTPDTSINLNKLRSKYGSTVTPVQEAIKRQTELSKIAASQNPALRMAYGDMPTIDQLIADPNKTQIGYSGKSVEDSAMALAAAAASRNVSDTFGKYTAGWMKHGKTTGFSREEIAQFMQDASNIPELADIINKVTAQFNNFDGLSYSQKAQMLGEIMSGIFKGASYKEDSNYQQDPGYWKQVDFNNQVELQKRAREAANEDRYIPIKDNEGNIKGYYDKQINMVVDKDKNIVANKDGDISKVGIGSKKEEKTSESKLKKYQDNYGFELEPIIADRASWGTGWDVGYVGQDNTTANWIDLSRETRDWGADFKIPSANSITKLVKFNDLDGNLQKKIINNVLDKAKMRGISNFEFNPDYYNIYEAPGGGLTTLGMKQAGYVMFPKDKDPYTLDISEYTENMLQLLLEKGYIDKEGNTLTNFEILRDGNSFKIVTD